ncbi:MAG: AAA family ATPase [Lachnospiraceae bacterium]|nr:AAA family ATPase [Lachnospiraceae bacterium]
MSDYAQAKKEIINYIYARTPLVIVNTNERERVERILYDISSETQAQIMYYTDAKQVKNIGGRSETIDTDDDPLGFFLSQIKKNRSLNIVLGDVRRISDDSAYSRELMNILYMARENNAVVILVTADPVWARISSFGMVVNLDVPTSPERIEQICKFIKTYSGRFTIEWDNDDVAHVAAILRGFTEIQIENILSAEIIGNKGLLKSRIQQISAQKQKIYPKVGTVQYIEPYKKYEISGMENLKDWLAEKKRIFFMPEDALKEYDLKAPKGILLVGVPGCGKSLTAKLVAQEWNLPLFRFDIGSVFDKWVGESEKKMREALQFIENVSPCLLWIDEIEKVLATSDSGNETGKRVLGEFLFWVQESSNKVFMVATANNVNVLPYELYRKGRFTEVFYAGLPNEKERRNTIRHYMNVSLKSEPADDLLDKLVALTEGYSYSDIETAVKEVAQKAILHEENITPEMLIAAMRSIIPISQINPELVRDIDKWGRERAVNVSREVK